MKKQILLGLFIVTILLSCRLNTKIKPPAEFKVVDTEMAELKYEPVPDIEILKKDTLEFLKFWKEFYKYYQQNDTAKLIKLSFDSVICPIYKEEYNNFQPESGYVSIADFLKAPFRKKYNLNIIPISKKDSFNMNLRYSYNLDTQNLSSKKDSVLLNYYVELVLKENIGNYEIRRVHSFSFIKINNSIKFDGLRIGESYSWFTNDSTTRANLYFSLYREMQDSLTNSHSLDTFTNLWYSNSLSGFKEPYLYNYKGEDEIYRFTWLRSFHNPITIRFQKHGNSYMLTTKEMIDYGGHIPNKIIVNTSQYLAKCEWNKLEFKLGRINFWNNQTLDPEPSPTDGAEWILEAYVKGKYHFTTRTMGEPDYRECCKYLILLSKLKIPKDAMY